MEDVDLIYKTIFSLGIGFLIGLEREYKAREEIFAGIRTFPLISLMGTISAFLAEKHLEWFVYLGFLAVALFAVVNFFLEYSKDRGVTTEISVLLTFLLGVIVYYGYYYLAGFIAVFLMFLLAIKKPLEEFTKHLYYEDIISLIKFLILTVLIYPILPDRYFGPFEFFNPKEIWKAVIIVATIDFFGYILLRWKGQNSLVMVGILGGLISSTAVTYNFSKLSKDIKSLAVFFGIVLSWSVMNLRIVFLTAILNFNLLKFLAIPFVILTFIYILYIYFISKGSSSTNNIEYNQIKHPFSVFSVFQFAVVYMVIFMLAKVLIYYYGNQGLLTLSFVSGIIDIDAIVISVSNMEKAGNLTERIAVLSVIIAVISNTIFKYLYVYIFGEKWLRLKMLGILGFTILYLLGFGIFFYISL